MKKAISLVLSAILALGTFAGCNNAAPVETDPPIETEPKKDYSQFAGIVADPKTWYDELMALPIANENMTEEELRQLCVDAFRVNMTFPWTPTKTVNYSYTLLEKTRNYTLPMGIAYSGLCYASGPERGNVWKILNYYDKETGALDIEAMGEDFLFVMSSACSRGCQWGWNRVCNSSGLTWMTSYEQGQSNIVLVGPYTYQPLKYSFNHGDGTVQIIAENGSATMFESYANMKMADGVYTSSGYHVMMCAQNPVVERWPDGTIDPGRSYVIVLEQDAVGSSTDSKNYQQSNGVTMRPLGGIDNKYTFQQLMDKGYVPFTIKELIGEDPIEPGKAWIGTEFVQIENGKDLTVTDIFNKNLFGNYALCTAEVQVKNAEGTVLKSQILPIETQASDYNTPIRHLVNAEDYAPFDNGTNTIHIYVRLSNGELLEAFNTVLKAG